MKPRKKKARLPRERVQPTPNWEKEPRPVAGGIAVIARCENRQHVPVFVKDIIPRQLVAEILAEIKAGRRRPKMPRCRHCGRGYLDMRPMRRREQKAAA